MFMKRGKLLALLALLGVVALLLACAAGEEEEATPTTEAGKTPVKATVTPGVVATVTVTAEMPQYGGTFRIALREPDAGWDWHKSVSYKTNYHQSLLQASLLQYPTYPGCDPYDLSVIPFLAESWEVSADGLTVTFNLRKGVKWHNRPPTNGREFVADDVKFTYEHMKRVGSGYYTPFEQLDSIEVVDKYTVRFKWKTPYAPFLTYLGDAWGYMYPREVEEEYGDMVKPENVVGTGPFMIKESVASMGTRYVRNPDYFEKDKYGNQLPYVDEVWVPDIVDSSTSLAALRAGNLDVRSVGIVDRESVQKSNPELKWYPAFVTTGSSFLWYNVSKPPFDDIRVRQAISMSLDRQMWLDSFYLGEGSLDNGAVPAAMTYWKLPLDQMGECAKYQQYNVAEAKKLLAEAGYPNGFETTLHFTTAYGSTSAEMAELWVDIVSQIGIKANVKTYEYGAWLTTPYLGKVEGMIWIPVTAFQEVDIYMWDLYHSESKARYVLNRIDGGDELDELIMAQRKEYDPEKRREIVYEIQRILACRCYRVVVPAGTTQTAYQPWLHDYHTKAASYNYGVRFTRYWLDETAPTRK